MQCVNADLTFYGHLSRMDGDRLTRKVFEHRNRKEKTRNKWIQMVKKDMALVNITHESVKDRKSFRKTVNGIKFFPEETKPKNDNRKWSEERRRNHSEMMEKYWEE